MTADCDYLNYMTDDISNNMAFVVSNWGGDASWLWHDRCSGDCNWPELTVSNIKVVQGGAALGTPAGAIDPSKYDFGHGCNSPHMDFCAEMHCQKLEECRWSWPKDDPAMLDSEEAACRCEHHY